MSRYNFTSESVSEGHPDKLADQISDSILDAYLKQDKDSRVAVESLLTNNLIMIAGEVTSNANVDIEKITRQLLLDVGYNSLEIGFDGASCGFTAAISEQSSEIATGVFNALEGRTEAYKDTRDQIEKLGAGDQGIIFGYANNDNSSYFPVAGKISHLLSQKHAEIRKTLQDSILLPDAKFQVTIGYENNEAVSIDNVLISTQHSKKFKLDDVKEYVTYELIKPVLSDYIENHHYGRELIDNNKYLINPAGEWNIGGPKSDAGLTGRKIIVDTYTGYAKHGGGAFSGKDPSKVDRSAAYALRWIAKNLVAAGAATELELQIAYAIGSSQPVSLYIDTKNKRSVGKTKIEGIINELFDLRPGAIIHDLELKTFSNYASTAKNGHFGRNPDNAFSWERLNKVNEIQNLL
jgi:S-adenosylmethionine synthetase